MRIAVIGGSGHIGSFLLPRLVRAGHEVLNLSRGATQPYIEDQTWAGARNRVSLLRPSTTGQP